MDPAVLPLPVAALTAAARKRSLLDPSNLDRLERRLIRDGVSTLPALRRWLQEGDINPKVGAVLLKLLPSHDERQLGGCHILAKLAEGGMGRVDLVAHEGKLRVLKTLPQARAGRTNPIRRFRREAAITATLDHPNIVRCHGQGEERGQLYLILDFIVGGDLQQLISSSGRLEEIDALAVIRQYALGLAFAHERHLIHRDVKPANAFIDENGTILVADFGLARSTDSQTSLLTAPGGAVGTPCYMAPEQIRGEESLGPACDCYALGCVLHACLLGHPPWHGSLQEVLNGHLNEPAPSIGAERADLGDITLDLHRRLLIKDPQQRTLSAAQVAERAAARLSELGVDTNRRLAQPTVSRSTRHVEPMAPPPSANTADTQSDSGGTETATQHFERPDAIFVGDLAHAEVGNHLRLALHGASPFLGLIADDACTIGRGADADIRIDDPDAAIGRRHCRIRVDSMGAPVIEDLASTNGTWLDGRWLAPGEAIPLAIGTHVLRLGTGIDLTLRILPQRSPVTRTLTGAPPGRERCLGLENPAFCDAIILSGPAMEHPLAFVLRRLVIGEDEDLPGAEHDSESVIEFGRYRGVWLLRSHPAPWQPLCPDTLKSLGLALHQKK